MVIITIFIALSPESPTCHRNVLGQISVKAARSLSSRDSRVECDRRVFGIWVRRSSFLKPLLVEISINK